MKYLKIFEEFSEDFYKKISKEEFDSFCKRKQVEFTKYQLDTIKDFLWQKQKGKDKKRISGRFKLFNIERHNSNGKHAGGFSHCFGSYILLSQYSLKHNIYIKQYDDEYFLVEYRFTIAQTYSRYYLCDQFDGLIDFINDLVNDRMNYTLAKD